MFNQNTTKIYKSKLPLIKIINIYFLCKVIWDKKRPVHCRIGPLIFFINYSAIVSSTSTGSALSSISS